MKKVLVIAMVLAMAGVAYADRTVFSEGNGVTMTAIPLDGAAGTPRGLVDYSNMDLTSPSWDVSATAVVVDEDDYQCATLTGTQMLESFRFVGGVENASEILWFNFYDSAHNYVDYAGVQFPQAGNYIWTITLSTPKAIPTDGIMDMEADSYYSTSTGHWFCNVDAPTVGTTGTAYGYDDGTDHNDYKFELTFVPEPASLLLLSLGLVIRRR